MAGLLGLEDDPASQGLLSLGLRLMSTPGKFGPALGTAGLGAMGDLNAAAQAKQRRDLLAQEQRSREQQMLMQQQLMQQQQQEQARQEAIRQAYAGAMRSPEQQAMGQFGGPTVAAANAAPGMAPMVDQAALIRSLVAAGAGPEAYALAQPKAKKLSKLEPMRGPDGKMVNVAVYEDGTTSVLPFGVRPDIALQNLGNRVQAIDKNDTSGGQAFTMGQSPDSAASNAVTMRGQNMTRDTAAARLAFDAAQAVGPAKMTATQERLEAEKAKAGRQGEQMVAAIQQSRELLANKPTASGVGAGVDWAGRMVGATSESAKTAAQLETLSGWMVANVPRMEGPQSNFDIQNYQVMAAKVGDRSTPVAERAAALDTLEGLHRKYAEINGTPLPAAPKSPKLNLEQVYRDADRIINGGR